MQHMPYIPALATIPPKLPPLERAFAILERASDKGFKWPSAEFVLKKINEEWAETKEAHAEGDNAHLAEEIGDVLSATVNLARFVGVKVEALSLAPAPIGRDEAITQVEEALHAAGQILEQDGDMHAPMQQAISAIAALAHGEGLDAGACLTATNGKFVKRFGAVEKELHIQGRRMEDTPLKEMIGLWNAQKDEPAQLRGR